jgi:hypothetical protein
MMPGPENGGGRLVSSVCQKVASWTGGLNVPSSFFLSKPHLTVTGARAGTETSKDFISSTMRWAELIEEIARAITDADDLVKSRYSPKKSRDDEMTPDAERMME